MLKFLDGPAEGVSLCCARAPLFLRVVKNLNADLPQWDALDQLDDKPDQSEVVYVYRKSEDHGTVHYCGRDKNGKRFGRWEQCADYRLHEEQPPSAILRDNPSWRAWAEAQHVKENHGKPAPE